MLDIDNGARFETYAILGGPGEVCLNGAAARLVHPGDKVIVITYADYEDAELADYAPRRRPRRRAATGRVHRPRRRAVARRDADRLTSRLERPGRLDLLVLGSGVAGLSAAVRAATEPGCRVGVLTKGELVQSATRWAQGGVAAVLVRRRGLHRPPPGRHAAAPAPACATSTPCACSSTRARPGSTS